MKAEKNYEISKGTYAICSNGENGSKILEEEGIYEIRENPSHIIEYGCNYFGSTYNGRREGSMQMLNSRYKVPIVIEDSRNMIFFPTANKEEPSCCWIALNKIKMYSQYGKKTSVEFINGERFIFDISFRSFQNQVLRASRLDSILNSRKKQIFMN